MWKELYRLKDEYPGLDITFSNSRKTTYYHYEGHVFYDYKSFINYTKRNEEVDF